MKIKNVTRPAITMYKGRFCAELENGEFILSDGSMHLLRCVKVPEGMKVVESDIIGGMMMGNIDDFRWCVEHL
ncbi:MAG: hypothetical protein II453_18470 [Alphaproteobacteria bacterium]|nr:hypothetical protein [Alphaproteobacteria bacterium]